MKYKVREFFSDVGQIVVEYFSDKGESLNAFAIDLPVHESEEGYVYPQGEELEKIIKDGFPFWVYDRLDKIKTGIINKEEIEKLVEPRGKGE